VVPSPGPGPARERADQVRRGGQDQCPVCSHQRPCCASGDRCGPGWTDPRTGETRRT